MTGHQPKKTRCKWCDGSGYWLLLRSWFVSDGYRRERCHVCNGTGKHSGIKPDADWNRFQKRARDGVKEVIG